jgi:hypothetical protein
MDASAAGPGAATELFSAALVSSYVDDARFVPRRWLVDRIQTALGGDDVRFVLLTGEPGSGKTAVMAHLARLCPAYLRYFIRRDSMRPLEGGDARTFLFAAGHQLAHLHPALFEPGRIEVVVTQRVERLSPGARMVGMEVVDLLASPFYVTALNVTQHSATVEGDLVGISAARATLEPRLLELSNLQYLALLDPAEVLLRADPGARIVILVDGLDEIRYGPRGENVLPWLAGGPEIPPNVRFVLASRPDADLLDAFRRARAPQLRELTIDPEEPRDRGRIRQDISRFVAGFAAEPAVAGALVVAGGTPAGFAAAATERAHGNFQYAVALARGIDQAIAADPRSADVAALLRVEGIPRGLSELYGFVLARVKEAADQAPVNLAADPLTEPRERPAWDALFRPVLAVLAVAFEPPSAEMIARYARVPTGALSRAMEGLGQFLDRLPDSRLRLYHATLPEYLTGRDTASEGPFHVDAAAWHALLAGRLLRAYQDWLGCADRYALSRTPAHLVEALRRRRDPAGAAELPGP